MGLLEDVMKTLDRIPVWKRLQGVPAEVDALRSRVAALEARLAPTQGEQCPKCRAMTFMLDRTEPAPAPWHRVMAVQDVRICSSCGHQQTDMRHK